METKQITSKEFFRGIKIVYFALLASPIYFTLIILFLNQNNIQFGFGHEFEAYFIYFVPLFIIIGIFGGDMLFKSKLKESIIKEDLPEKLFNYRSGLIIKYAFLESSIFIAVAVFFMTGDTFFLGLTGISMLVFLFNIPTIERATKDLKLNKIEMQKMQNPNAVLGEVKI